MSPAAGSGAVFTRPEREVDRVFLHCSASDDPEHDSIDVIRRWHVDGNGWDDVGYHYFIRRDGTLEAGRPLEKTPAAQAGNNAATIAICLHGLTLERFTKAQYRTLIDLATAMDDACAGMLSFHGHCEVSSKSCPVFPYRAVLGLDGHGAMAFHPTDSPGFADAPRATAHDATSSPPTLRITSKHPQVMTVQHLLSEAGHPLEEDGLFGQATLEAVRTFQRQHGLRPDGIVGPRTWSALSHGTPERPRSEPSPRREETEDTEDT